MSYEHHVFISYARGEEWMTQYVTEVFTPRLNGYLKLQVGYLEEDAPPAFVDNQIQDGARWDDVLKHKIATSTVMVCLFSAIYFQRPWCRLEMAVMLDREKHCGLEGRAANYGLVIPIHLGGDDDYFPELAKRVQCQNFETYADPDILTSPRASEFNAQIQRLAKTIANTISKAPQPCCPDWQHFTGEDYIDQLQYQPLPTMPPRIRI